MCIYSVTREETEKLLLTYRTMATVKLDKQKKTPSRLSGSKDESLYVIDRSHFRDMLHKSFGMTDDFLMDRGLLCGSTIEPQCCVVRDAQSLEARHRHPYIHIEFDRRKF